MGQVGGRVDSPMTLLREYATALRSCWPASGSRTQGRYVQLEDVALDWPPEMPPPLMMGGAGPKSLALAAELGDGNLLDAALTDDEVEAAVGRVITERAGPGPSAGGHPDRRHRARAQERVDAEVPKWGKPAGIGIGVAGDAATIARRVRRLAELGATSVVIQPCEDEPDLEGFIAFLGAEVRPLLS